MGRASGRKNPTRQVTPDSPEGREIGMSERQDPSGGPINSQTGNIVNYPTVRQEPKVGAAFPEHRGIMAHGVPPETLSTEERALMERDGTAQHNPPLPPEHYVPRKKPTPVPVYITEPEGGSDVFLTASPRNLNVPAINTADPVRIAGRNVKRNRIGLLNESTSTNIRFAKLPSDLVNGGGALLPWPNTSYSWFETQDELYALTVSAGGTAATISIIEEFEQGL